MSGTTSKEFSSVDLTEDEDSSEENSGQSQNPFHFVDCSKSTTNFMQGSQSRGATSTPLKTSNSCLSNKVGNFTSVQIKPPNHKPAAQEILEGDTVQEIETVSIDSDTELETNQSATPSKQNQYKMPDALRQNVGMTVPEKNPIFTASQPPGKVVIIKKNNKYYKIIIPHNVMPNINKSMGPVLINIPEVGPLVISNDPQAAAIRPNPFIMQKVSLNLDAVAQKQPVVQNVVNTNVLSNKKFCWTYNTHRKRDLDGFMITDRLGFTFTDKQKAKKCARTMETIVRDFDKKLASTLDEYNKFKRSLETENKVKLVKINTIIKGKTKKGSTKVNTKETEGDYEHAVESDSKVEDYDSDLLVPRKVVILDNYNKTNKKIGVKKMVGEVTLNKETNEKRRPGRPRKRKELNSRPHIKTCYVQIPKNKQVEEASKKYCRQTGLKLKKRSDIHCKKNEKSTTKNKKIEEKQQERLSSISVRLETRIILTKEKLLKSINLANPHLLVTEHSVGLDKSLETYRNDSFKNNIIYAVNRGDEIPAYLLKNANFVRAVEIGYVKLVEKNLFCKFVSGAIFGDGKDHSYSKN